MRCAVGRGVGRPSRARDHHGSSTHPRTSHLEYMHVLAQDRIRHSLIDESILPQSRASSVFPPSAQWAASFAHTARASSRIGVVATTACTHAPTTSCSQMARLPDLA